MEEVVEEVGVLRNGADEAVGGHRVREEGLGARLAVVRVELDGSCGGQHLRARQQRVQAEHAVHGVEQVHKSLYTHRTEAVVVHIEQAAHRRWRGLPGLRRQLPAHVEQRAELREHAHADELEVDHLTIAGAVEHVELDELELQRNPPPSRSAPSCKSSVPS